MPEENILSVAFGRAKLNHGHIKAETEETEEKHSHSYSMACPACKSTIQFADEDLEQWRTDEEAGSTSEDDPDEDEDEDDNDDEDEDRASALTARIIKAAKTNQK